ncbi:DNA mismatch repair protein [Pyricularia oryzae 70-15]|uniref:DNA mismatch repair protein n=1 Tax=Pyricularia oryzae (strain 70-15 / ATCC MYA-4617 / FGSC 8958) TaxID=242507 RepID=G4N9G6_PYRO7|nr:DNA mismatch repair protein [Pyricularia oryzae 70-15]EHA50358.1 DNA mismatch repair protein [Pyricularia oryzae 70-15]
MSIKPLPPEVAAQVKSSSVITSLNGVALGLLRNSLDANATKVNISVDYRLGNCIVEDNGFGVPETEFRDTGGLGKLHFTSKFPPQDNLYGRNGAFLFSVASLSLLSVTSHHQRQNSHATLVTHNSELVSRHIPALPEQRILVFPHGTRVAVRDLFGSMPVRVKQRALEAARTGSGRDWGQLVRMVVSLLLGFTGIAAVTLRDMQSTRVLTLRSDSSSLISRTSRILSRAALWDNPDVAEWVPLSASSAGITIDGCVSLAPAPSKKMQFITLDMEPISDDLKSNVLFDEINKVFANSQFGFIEDLHFDTSISAVKSEGAISNERNRAKKGIDRWPVFYLRISLQGCIPNAALASKDAVLDGGHDALPKIMDLLKAMFYAFLKKHSFCPHKVDISGRTSRISPVKRPCLTEHSHGHTTLSSSNNHPATTQVGVSEKTNTYRIPLSRNVISGSNPQTSGSTGSLAYSPTSAMPKYVVTTRPPKDSNMHSATFQGPVVGTEDIAVDDKKFGSGSPNMPLNKHGASLEIAPSQAQSQTSKSGGQLPEGYFRWENPATKVTSLVDSKTGFIMRSANERPSINRTRNTPAMGNQEAKQKEASPWLKNLLALWENPVFETTEAAIPRLADTNAGFGDATSKQSGCSLSLGRQGDRESLALEGRFSKSSLQHCEVVSQVDQKFILAKLPIFRNSVCPAGQTVFAHNEKLKEAIPSLALVIIDQHAADERCRVEALMAGYFEINDSNGNTTPSPVAEMLSVPVVIDLTRQECDLLEHYISHFRRWGIWYEMISVTQPAMATTEGGRRGANQEQNRLKRVCVTRLPPSILERCRSEPSLLVELLRKEVWRLEEDETISRAALSIAGRASLRESSDEAEHSWVPWFHGCPPGILELIISRACRSAIMFGDSLSVEDCRALLDRLGKCAFPFQCAHGRPSMVPLLELGDHLPGCDSSEIW